jgi:hypothetical protein
MRTARFVLTLVASFVLTACASGSALDVPPRNAAPDLWTPRALYIVRPQPAPVVDTTAQREALRRTPHGGGRFNSGTAQR